MDSGVSFGRKQPNILIVDDVSANLVMLSEWIKEIGYNPIPVTSVKQAIDAIGKKKPQLILLDITMPDMDGYEFCAMLKNDAATKEIPIIFISALDAVDDKVKGYEAGGVDYIAKPFEKLEVTLRVNTHLKIYQMQHELEETNKKLRKMVIDQMNKTNEEQRRMLFALAPLIEAKEKDGKKHIEYIGRNCRMLAISLQFLPKYDKEVTNRFVEEIEIASKLHNIGSIAVSDKILFKPGKLDDDERTQMQEHTRIGARHLEAVCQERGMNSFMKMAIEIARYHHENWDGTGYPDGLSGTDIPLPARIMAIVDTFVALNRERSYRNAYNLEESLDIMRQLTGKRFDPDIMKIFFKIQKQLKV